MAMNQKTTSPIPSSPGRKLNPKMTTNVRMLIPKGKKEKAPVPAPVPVKQQRNNPPAQPQQAPAVENKPTEEQVQREKMAASAQNKVKIIENTYETIAESIVQNVFISEEVKKDLAVRFVKDIGQTAPFTTFLFKTQTKSIEDGIELFRKAVEYLSKTINVVKTSKENEEILATAEYRGYIMVVKEVKKLLDLLFSAFISPTDKTNYFVALLNITVDEGYSYPEEPKEELKDGESYLSDEELIGAYSLIHTYFFEFSLTLAKAGQWTTLTNTYNQ